MSTRLTVDRRVNAELLDHEAPKQWHSVVDGPFDVIVSTGDRGRTRSSSRKGLAVGSTVNEPVVRGHRDREGAREDCPAENEPGYSGEGLLVHRSSHDPDRSMVVERVPPQWPDRRSADHRWWPGSLARRRSARSMPPLLGSRARKRGAARRCPPSVAEASAGRGGSRRPGPS